MRTHSNTMNPELEHILK